MIHIPESSLISKIEYDQDSWNLTIHFHTMMPITYLDAEPLMVLDFIQAPSAGKFYLRIIKSHLNTKHMADRIIKCKVDVTKINKDYLFTGEKGVYLNFTVLFNEEQDGYGNNGMIVQDVPTETYKKDKSLKGNILGNVKQFPKGGGSEESKPGVESGKPGVAEGNDDLPF